MDRWPADSLRPGAAPHWRAQPATSSVASDAQLHTFASDVTRAAPPSSQAYFSFDSGLTQNGGCVVADAWRSAGTGPPSEGLERLATEYEDLVARLSAGASAQAGWQANAFQSWTEPTQSCAEVLPQQMHLMRRLDALAENIAHIATCLHASGSGSSSSAPVEQATCSLASVFPSLPATASLGAPPMMLAALHAQPDLSASAQQNLQAPAAAVTTRSNQEDEVTPRGRQVRQNASEGIAQRHVGRAARTGRSKLAARYVSSILDQPRNASATGGSPKALSISIHKVSSLLTEPASPKGVMRPPSWGSMQKRSNATIDRPPVNDTSTATTASGSGAVEVRRNTTSGAWQADEAGAEEIKTRIEKMLGMGESRVNRGRKPEERQYLSAPLPGCII